MSLLVDQLKALARAGSANGFEGAWLEAIGSDPALPVDTLMAALVDIAEAGKAETAVVCGATWLESVGDSMSPAKLWDVVRRILLLGDSPDLRKFAVEAFRAAHADRDDLDRLLDVSGLAGKSSPKRAMRLLDLAMQVSIGAPLIDHETGGICRVEAIGPEGVTITGGVIDEILSLGQVASRYILLDENDYRYLLKADPAKLIKRVKKDPEAFLVNLLHSHGERIRSDDLKRIMAGSILPEADWAKWWTKARNRIKTSHHIVSEGRNPVVLTYVEGGVSLEDQAWDAFIAANSHATCRQVIGQYFRDAKRAKVDADTQAAFVDRVLDHYRNEHRRQSGHDNAAAFVAAMTVEQISQTVGRPVGADDSPALAMLRKGNAVAVLGSLEQIQLWPLALQLVSDNFPETRSAMFLEIVAAAPVGQLDEIAKRLIDADESDALRERIAACMEDSKHCPDVLYWIWRRPNKSIAAALPKYESKSLLQRIFTALEDAEHAIDLSKKQQGRIRTAMRAALADRKYARFQECLDQMEYSMASSLRSRINLITHLSTAAKSDLLKFVSRKFPNRNIHDVPRWKEQSTIYTTAAGHAKRSEELRVLAEEKIPANAIAIGKAREKGDLSENAEYTTALEERGLLGRRAATIQDELAQASVLNVGDISTNSVQIGSRLRLRRGETGAELAITLLGPWDVDLASHIYSYRAPMFQEMMSKAIGEAVELNLDDHHGAYEILAIENALAEDG